MTRRFSSHGMLRHTDWQIVTGVAKDYRFFLDCLTMTMKSLRTFENSVGSYQSMQHNIPDISNLQATPVWGLQIRTWPFVWTRSPLLFSTLNCSRTYIIFFNSTLSAHMCALWIFQWKLGRDSFCSHKKEAGNFCRIYLRHFWKVERLVP
jgi:hypothetical protein